MKKGQGAQKNEINRFDRYTFEAEDEDFEKVKTSFTEVFPKTIVNEVKSPDLRMEYSIFSQVWKGKPKTKSSETLLYPISLAHSVTFFTFSKGWILLMAFWTFGS